MKFTNLIVIESLIIGLLLCGCQPGNGNYPLDDVEQEIPDDDTPATPEGNLLAEIQQTIFSPICAQCHIGSTAPAGLQLDDQTKALANLVNVQAIGNPQFKRVVPNDPTNSYLMKKILGDPIAGQRMPLGMAALSSTQIKLISDWIEQGATAVSQTSFSKMSNVAIVETDNLIEITINFDNAIDKTSLMYASVPVYQIIEQQKYLLDLDSYNFELVTPQELVVNISKNQLFSQQQFNSPLFSNKLTIELGQISQMPLLSLNGQAVDVDADNLEGGSYVIKINHE